MYRFFKKKREAIKKYLLVFFLSVVSIGMVITLAPIPGGDSSRMESNVLASVAGVNITTQELQQALQARFRNIPTANQAGMVPKLAPRLLDELVLQRAVIREAHRMGLEISDPELRQSMQGIPWLYQNGAFIGMDRYQAMISQQTGLSVERFEDELRTGILTDKLRGVVTDGMQVPPQQVQAEFRKLNTKAKVEYVLFDPGQYIKAVEVTPATLEAFFKKDPGRYKLAEQRKVRYVLVDPDAVRSQAKVDDAEVRQYYTLHLADYRVPDRVKVAHILFKTTGKTPAQVVTLEKTARDVLAQIRAGGDFAALAKKYSEDGSASKGGDIGWIVRGQTVKEFENTAFAMQPGQVGDIIKTTYGFHIVKLLDKQTAHLQTFDEVKEAIRSDLEKQKLADAQQKLADELASQSRANPQQFEALARKAGLEAKESPLFKYGQPVTDLGNSDAFENLAFQLRKNEVGQPITVPRGQAIIQVVEIVPEHVPALEEVRAQVEADYRTEQSKALAADKANQFAARAKQGDFQKLAKSMGATAKESKEFTSQDYVEGLGPASQLTGAFTLNPGQTSDALAAGAGEVVFRLVSRTPANDADFPQQRDRIAEELLDRQRSLAFEFFRENLKVQLLRTGELKINDQALKQFLAAYQNP